jgi:hypothetical protein
MKQRIWANNVKRIRCSTKSIDTFPGRNDL